MSEEYALAVCVGGVDGGEFSDLKEGAERGGCGGIGGGKEAGAEFAAGAEAVLELGWLALWYSRY